MSKYFTIEKLTRLSFCHSDRDIMKLCEYLAEPYIKLLILVASLFHGHHTVKANT